MKIFIKRGAFGYDGSNEIFPDHLQQAKLDVKDYNALPNPKPVFDSNLLYSVIHAKNSKSIQCSGDSGGPLMYFSNNKWSLYGIVSFDENKLLKCSYDNTLFFVQVPKYLDWIKKTIFYLDKISYF